MPLFHIYFVGSALYTLFLVMRNSYFFFEKNCHDRPFRKMDGTEHWRLS